MTIIVNVTVQPPELSGSCSRAATKQDLDDMENRIMATVSEFKASFDAKLATLHQEVDGINTGFEGVSQDVAAIKAALELINTNPGTLTPADQQLLDEGLVKLDALGTRLEAIKTGIQALDAATDPVQV